MINCIKKVCLALVAGLTFVAGWAQDENPSNLTSSPYTRYGLGKLGDVGNTITRGMGGLGIAVRNNAYTNLANPASLTSIDTLTMIFDGGLEAQYARYSERGVTDSRWNAGFSYFSFHFPLWRNFAMALSLTPYSMVGYGYGSSDTLAYSSQIKSADTLIYETDYSGSGGFSKVMASIGWKPFSSRRQSLSVGVDVGFIFGTSSHDGIMYIKSGHGDGTITSRSMTARALDLGFGVQYTRLLSPTKSLTLGATFSPKMNMSIDAEILKLSDSDTITTESDIRLNTPMKVGAGASLSLDRKWQIGAEFSFENWQNVSGLTTNLQKSSHLYKNISKFAAGFEYRPSIIDQNYFKTCRYRAGFSAKNSYIEVYGSQNWEYTASLGMSFPVGQGANKRSLLNFAVEYSHLSPSKSDLVAEHYVKLSLGITFNEVMFFRNKLK